MEDEQLNASIRGLSMPQRMRRRPVSERGYPVPWFVAQIDGQWDFRAIGPGKIADAHNGHLCWLCGEKLGQYLAFVVGPMCTVNRTTSELSCHLECAEYAVRACPHLTHPNMRRNEVDMPEKAQAPAGVSLKHNPGATAIYITKSYRPFKVSNGVLFEMGEPINVLWYREGRRATRSEVLEAMQKGLPRLQEYCHTQRDRDALQESLIRAMRWLPRWETDDARPVRHEEQSGQGVRDLEQSAAPERPAAAR